MQTQAKTHKPTIKRLRTHVEFIKRITMGGFESSTNGKTKIKRLNPNDIQNTGKILFQMLQNIKTMSKEQFAIDALSLLKTQVATKIYARLQYGMNILYVATQTVEKHKPGKILPRLKHNASYNNVQFIYKSNKFVVNLTKLTKKTITYTTNIQLLQHLQNKFNDKSIIDYIYRLTSIYLPYYIIDKYLTPSTPASQVKLKSINHKPNKILDQPFNKQQPSDKPIDNPIITQIQNRNTSNCVILSSKLNPRPLTTKQVGKPGQSKTNPRPLDPHPTIQQSQDISYIEIAQPLFLAIMKQHPIPHNVIPAKHTNTHGLIWDHPYTYNLPNNTSILSHIPPGMCYNVVVDRRLNHQRCIVLVLMLFIAILWYQLKPD